MEDGGAVAVDRRRAKRGRSWRRIFCACLLAQSAFLAAPDAGLAFDAGTLRKPTARESIEVAFSPWDDTEGLVLRTIQSAKSTIYVQAYIFTSRKVADALIDAKRRGVRVEVLADRETTLKGRNRIADLADAGISVWLEYRYAVAHNKVIITDPRSPDCAVVTGSYNFTYSAHAKNAENVLVIRSNPDVARSYYNNFLRHRDGAIPYRAALPPDN
ncbi:MAG: phospholipase D family protein [Rhodocyclaceae bacterium]